MKFKCRKCRGLICVGDQVIDHTTGVSPDWSQSFCEPPYCLKGVFIVDAQMVVTRSESLLSRTTEKYNCIKCGSKIGNIGLASCGCGASVSRGIWINSSKVDKSRHWHFIWSPEQLLITCIVNNHWLWLLSKYKSSQNELDLDCLLMYFNCHVVFMYMRIIKSSWIKQAAYILIHLLPCLFKPSPRVFRNINI